MKSYKTKRPSRITCRMARGAVALALGAFALQGCELSDKLLEARDPDLIDPNDIRTAEGADATRIGALSRLSNATARDVSTWMFGGLLADEWTTSSTFFQNDETDQRVVQQSNSIVTAQFRDLNRVRTAANQAITGLRQFRAKQVANIGEMYMVRGFAEMQLAQDFCNGIPLSDASGSTNVLGKPLPVDSVFARAVASFDTALSVNTDTTAFGVRVRNTARVLRGRALMGRNLYPEAVAAVAGVPTSFAYQITFIQVSGSNIIWGQNNSAGRFTVGDSVEGNARNILVRNALPFFSARDPRLPVTYLVSNAGRDTARGQDGFTFLRTQGVYSTRETAIDLANGIDARLIEAEAQLKAGNVAAWLATLNALRASPQTLGALTTEALPPLADPGNTEARISLLFREKAFWTFSRGQRLGDLRRLIRQYGRTQDNVFPTGMFFKGNTYGGDVNLPIPQEELNNPNFTGCTDRRA